MFAGAGRGGGPRMQQMGPGMFSMNFGGPQGGGGFPGGAGGMPQGFPFGQFMNGPQQRSRGRNQPREPEPQEVN